MAMKINNFESQEQISFFEYVNAKLIKKYPFLDKLLFAVPNGGKRSITTATTLKAEGVKKGVADIILLYPSQEYNFLCIEMKYGKNKKSKDQEEFESRVDREGGGVYQLAYSAIQAQKILAWYLGRDAIC